MLAYRLAAQPGDILSGYLSRLAHAHGQPPNVFFPVRLKAPHFWFRDVDRGLSAHMLRSLSDLISVSVEELQRLTLSNMEAALTPASYSAQRRPGVVPWLNAIRARTVAVRLPALQFCPACLGEGRSPRKLWRLAFVTTCERHGRPLLNRCAHCGLPFLPFLSVHHSMNCPRCGANLSQQGADHWREEWARGLPNIQRALLAAVDEAAEELTKNGERRTHSGQLLALRELVALYPRWLRYNEWMRPPARCDAAAHERLELASIEYRCRAMSWLEWLLDDWPMSFRKVAQSANLTQRSFCRTHHLPAWLQSEIDGLPCGQPRNPFGRIDALAVRLTELSNDRPENWRSLRARSLMLAIDEKTRHGPSQ